MYLPCSSSIRKEILPYPTQYLPYPTQYPTQYPTPVSTLLLSVFFLLCYLLRLSPAFSLYAPCMLPVCSLYAPCMLPVCSLYAPCKHSCVLPVSIPAFSRGHTGKIRWVRGEYPQTIPHQNLGLAVCSLPTSQ